MRGESDKVVPQTPHEPTAGVGEVLQGQEEDILARMMTGATAKQSPVIKEAGKKKVKKTPARKGMKKEEKKEDVSGMVEMQRMMKEWTSRKRRREEFDEGDETAERVDHLLGPGAGQVRDVDLNVVNVDKSDKVTVDNPLVGVDFGRRGTLVERARRRFDSDFRPRDPDPDQDYNHWKLGREEKRRRLREQSGQVQQEGVAQGGGVGKDQKSLDSVSATGKRVNSISNINLQCSSLLGGRVAGVQHAVGVQEGGGDTVHPVQLESELQRATRMGGNFSQV